MKLSCLLILLAFFTGFFTLQAQAETGLQERLTTLNRIQPLQRPEFDQSRDILNRRVIGRKNKVLGEVEDVLLNDNGNITALQVELDRLGHTGQPVYLNYNASGAEPVTRGYMLGYAKEEVEKLYPTLLANVETAGGEENIYSLKKLPGTEIRTPDGTRIAQVSDVLFAARGDRAQALYITLSQNGKSLAIPFNLAEITHDGGQLKATVTQEQADAITAFAKTLK